jgi:hypothetical protein
MSYAYLGHPRYYPNFSAPLLAPLSPPKYRIGTTRITLDGDYLSARNTTRLY